MDEAGLKASSWALSSSGRLFRNISIRGAQYVQWDHKNGPVCASHQRSLPYENSIPRPLLAQRQDLAAVPQIPQHTAPYTLFPRSETEESLQSVAQENPFSRTQDQNLDHSYMLPQTASPRPVHEHGTRLHAEVKHHSYQCGPPGIDDAGYITPENDRRGATFGMARATISHLSQIGQSFARISMGDYGACQEFIARHPQILEENLSNFQLEALRLQKEGKPSQVRTCIQQLLLLKDVSNMTNDESSLFFKRMQSKDSNNDTLKRFLERFDIVLEAIRAKATVSRAGRTISTQVIRNLSEDELVEQIPNTSYTSTRHTPEQRRLPSIDDGLSASMDKLNVDVHDQKDPARSYAARGNDTRPLPVTYRPASGKKLALLSADEDSPPTLSMSNHPQTTPPTSIGSNYDIRRDGKEREELDQRYFVRHDSAKFFRIGRVFAMLWHEGAGDPKGGHLSHKERFRAYTADEYCEMIYSRILRMVVVRVRHGYCWCIPIQTYNGRGVLRPGFNRQDQEAHAIIYMHGTEPTASAEERCLMVKKPIAVHPASPDQKLHSMSRVNFGAPHSVKWNVKVMDVGLVTAESMPAFEGYWRNEMTAA